MRTTARLNRAFLPALLLLGWWAAFSASAPAQSTQGDNAVYNTAPALAASTAYIDASAFTGADICARIHSALGVIASGSTAVIDARGITTGLTCAVGKTPWVYTTTITTSSTILLPAAPILLNTGWTMPSATRIIGVGGGANSSSATAGTTTIRACTSSTPTCSQNFTGTMIVMGNSTTQYCPFNAASQPVCTGMSVENLWLDGQGLSITGITNTYAQEQSYVKHVTFYQLATTGLNVGLPGSGSGTSQNSGPYSDLACTVGTNVSSSTVCARIVNVSTRGIHGLTCLNTSATIPTNAVAIDGPNNSIEDVKVQGFEYGIRIGASASAPNNLFKNITGGSGVTSAVFITNISGNSVHDIVLLGVASGGATDTIIDNRTTPTTTLTDATVGMYVLGEPMAAGSNLNIGYSRFTTSPSVATWGHGSIIPSGTCTLGSLYSDTNGGNTGHTFAWYVCAPSGSSTAWSGVK